ncbi:MAG: DUF1540 domain-containing protein [Elusimicrobia bacterium]|nr:DUF1540 domain-containing protein [Elusimicrobiota bacterium]
MKTAKILSCGAESCAYNKKMECHALAITVGSSHQQCDTYMEDSRKGGVAGAHATVGACHMKNCRFNKLLECSASEIVLGAHTKHGDCCTFQPG